MDGLAQVTAAGAGMLSPVFDDMEHLEMFAPEIAPTLSGGLAALAAAWLQALA